MKCFASKYNNEINAASVSLIDARNLPKRSHEAAAHAGTARAPPPVRQSATQTQRSAMLRGPRFLTRPATATVFCALKISIRPRNLVTDIKTVYLSFLSDTFKLIICFVNLDISRAKFLLYQY